MIGRSYQYHTCLREFSRADSLRRHLESSIGKQIEYDAERDVPSENSEGGADDDVTSSEEDELPQTVEQII